MKVLYIFDKKMQQNLTMSALITVYFYISITKDAKRKHLRNISLHECVLYCSYFIVVCQYMSTIMFSLNINSLILYPGPPFQGPVIVHWFVVIRLNAEDKFW